MARSKTSQRWLKEHFDDPYVKMEPTHSETADGHALFAQHAQNAAAAGRAPTLAEQLVDLAA
ncbi:ribosomal RNA large subunit methyltransferase E [Pseudomonas aeruginosa PA38182]|nr:ribosomal RNA large subunit methyltransferase E [Pseudomonas aeruginosa PA38182]